MSLTIDEQVRVIADGARRSAPKGWQKIVLHAEALANVVKIRLAVTLADGSVTKRVRPERGLGALVAELRGKMHDPAKGTWYVADFTVDGTEVDVEFDYETCPFGGLIVEDDLDSGDADPDLVLEDHTLYPRPVDQLPEWHPARG